MSLSIQELLREQLAMVYRCKPLELQDALGGLAHLAVVQLRDHENRLARLEAAVAKQNEAIERLAQGAMKALEAAIARQDE